VLRVEGRIAPVWPPARLLLLIERLLLTIGTVLLGWYGFVRLQTAYDQAMASRAFEEIRMSTPASSPAVPAPPPRVAPGDIVGRVAIPRVGVSAIVREGDDATILQRAVGHIPGTAFPGGNGNAALAGHRDTFFRGLRNIRKGDDIVLSTSAGDAHYIVENMRIVDPSEVSVLAPAQGSVLTLVTCYPFNYIGSAPRRFIVRAERTDGIADGANR
jgi:sortase A